MLKEKNYLFQRLNQLLDVLLIGVAFFVALWTRNWLLIPNIFPTQPVISLEQHHWLIWLMAPIMLLTQMGLGVYNSQRMRKVSDLMIPIAIAALVTAVIGFAVVFGLSRTVMPSLQIISKPQIVYFAVWILVLLMIKGYLMKRFFLPSAAAA